MKMKIVNQMNVLVKKSMMMAHPIVLLDKMNSVAPVPHPLSSYHIEVLLRKGENAIMRQNVFNEKVDLE